MRDIYLYDYYEGFEGNSEIIFYFRDTNNQKYVFNMWGAYFDAILDFLHYLKFVLEIDLSSNLVIHYCCADAWYDNDWLIPNKENIVDDLATFLEYFTKPHKYEGEDENLIYNEAPLLKEIAENLIVFIHKSENHQLYIVED